MACLAAASQAVDPAQDPLNKAYEALRARQFDKAIEQFRKAVAAAPNRSSIRKDLAYAYLKTGETEAAREEFAEAMRLAPKDQQAALEYAFLSNDTGRTAEARRIFDRIRKSGGEEARATAEQAFQNIDRPLAEGIARWTKALEASPNDFSAHHELARLAEQRDDLELAATHYRKAWTLRPELRGLLVDLAKVWKAQCREEQAKAAVLAASRSKDTRTSEAASELLAARYPYVYEFRNAVEVDPANIELRRELAYLLLAMERPREAERELEGILERAPDDLPAAAQLGLLRLGRRDVAGAKPLLEKVLSGNDKELAERVRAALRPPSLGKRSHQDAAPTAVADVRTMADRSYKAGYLRDALRYYAAAHESDPLDFPVILQLGWTHNVLRQDDHALRWFALARNSPDPAIAREATKAYKSLRPALARYRTTVWFFPMYSTRWKDVFSYGQVKAEAKLGPLPVRSYVSMRFIGDTRHTTGEARPQYLSESSFILGAGLATDPWQGLVLWAEAGSAASYRRHQDVARLVPDYRGGVSFSRGFGHMLGSGRRGFFIETNNDGVFISRFQNDFLLYSQNRLGLTLPAMAALGGLELQVFWNTNASADAKRQYWANTIETGPGLRFRWKAMPAPWMFSVGLVRGVYTVNEGNPRRPEYYDLRIGMWYAVTR